MGPGDLLFFLGLVFFPSCFYLRLYAVFGYHVSQVLNGIHALPLGRWCSDLLDGLDGVGCACMYVPTLVLWRGQKTYRNETK